MILEVEHLSFAYRPERPLFYDVSFAFEQGQVLSILGANGAGKSTLLNCIANLLLPQQGEIRLHGTPLSRLELREISRIIGYVPQSHTPAYDYTVRDFVVMGRAPHLGTFQQPGRADYDLVDATLEEMGLLPLANRPYTELSGGERQQVTIARVIVQQPELILLDEPTNHLDLEGRRVVSRYLSRKSGFLLVSHDRAFLDGCVDHIMVINKRDIEVRQGSFSAWWRDKQARDDWERAENARLKREIGRLEDAARRTASWSDRVEAAKKGCRNSGLRPDRGYLGHKAQKMMRRSKAVEARRTEAAEAKAGLLKNIELAEALKLRPLEYPKRCLLEARELAPDYGAGPVCRPVSFTVERGERVALVGRNGSGKSSLLRLALGEEIPLTGLFSLASGLVVSYVPQDASFLRGSLSQFARRYELDETQFKTILRKLDFARVQFEKDLSDYSAGQKKKVLLARSLCQSAHLYVWDEPLNYIDVFSRMQLEELLRACRPAMLLVEHDQAFLEGLADKRVELVPA